jgi:hypothetical protein
MPRDSNGNFTLVSGNPVITGTTIASAWGNNTLSDIATVLTASLDRSGNGGMLAAFKLLDGTVGAPGLTFANEPTTGLYRSAANTVGLSIGGTLRFTFTPTTFVLSGQSVTLGAPASSYQLQANGSVIVNSGSLQVTGSGVAGFTGAGIELLLSAGTGYLQAYNRTTPAFIPLQINGNSISLAYGTGGAATVALAINSTGNIVTAAPTAGIAFTISGFASSNVLVLDSGSTPGTSVSDFLLNRAGSNPNVISQGPNVTLFDTTNTTVSCLQQSGGQTELWQFNGGWRQVFKITTNLGFVGGANTIAGVAFTINGFNGVHSTQIADAATNLFNVGFLEVPVVGTGGNRTCILSDNGKSIIPSTTGTTQTIPANSAVAYPIGATLTFEYLAAGSVTIAINADTLTWLGTGAAGSRTLSQFGKATAHKVAATQWVISGVNLT